MFVPKEYYDSKIFGIFDLQFPQVLFVYSLTLFVDIQSLYIFFFWFTSDNRLLVIHLSFFCVFPFIKRIWTQDCFFRDMFIL